MTLAGILDEGAAGVTAVLEWAAAVPTQAMRLWHEDGLFQFHGTTVLDFVRGPALQVASFVMIAGIVWRLSGILLLPMRKQHATSRASPGGQLLGAVAMVFTRSVPRRTFWPRIRVSVALSTVFHVGFIAILVGGAPHILVIHQISGLSWPNLPKGIVVLISGLTLAALVALLARRIAHPVTRLLSTTDDYLSWFVVFLPVLTGILLSGETVGSYQALLALHIMSVELLMIWLPFGKLMHGALVFASRGAMGFNFARKGAAT